MYKRQSLAYDSNSNKVVALFSDGGDSYYGKGIVGTVSGTSISFGTPTTFETGNTRYTAASFDPNANKVVVVYQAYGNSSYGRYSTGTVSGNSISFATPVVYNATTTKYSGLSFDSTENTMVIGYENQGNSSYGTGVVLRNAGTATNSADFIGITAGAISNAATGTVNVYGGINEAQTGLTVGQNYYVQSNGSLSTAESNIKAGRAISATTINMVDLIL